MSSRARRGAHLGVLNALAQARGAPRGSALRPRRSARRRLAGCIPFPLVPHALRRLSHARCSPRDAVVGRKTRASVEKLSSRAWWSSRESSGSQQILFAARSSPQLFPAIRSLRRGVWGQPRAKRGTMIVRMGVLPGVACTSKVRRDSGEPMAAGRRAHEEWGAPAVICARVLPSPPAAGERTASGSAILRPRRHLPCARVAGLVVERRRDRRVRRGRVAPLRTVRDGLGPKAPPVRFRQGGIRAIRECLYGLA